MGMSASYVAASDDDLSALNLLDADSVSEAIFDATVTRWVDHPAVGIETWWHGLHFVLTGSADSTSIHGVPLSEAVLGTDEFGASPDGYATTVRSGDVAQLLAALRDVDREELVATFEPAELDAHDIYPSRIWLRDDPKALVLALLKSLDALTAFYAATCARGLGVLVRVS